MSISIKSKSTASKSIAVALGAFACAVFAPAAANAALIGTATSVTGASLYEGLGETSAGSGIGTGRWAIGDCSFDGTNTTCSLSGSYTEDAGSSNNPGGVGTYIMNMVYSGNGPNPAIARSVSPGDDELTFLQLGDALFTLSLFPSSGGTITGQFPADPFSNSIGFSVFLAPGATCTGLPTGQSCGTGNVGLVAGAVLSGTFNAFNFSIPDDVLPPMTDVPLPAALIFMLTGGMALGGAAAKKKKRA